mmetsp:Transcript_89219/g.174595  ORF Transcript_89219/g.174595 Transcript_89219/m.174595 type:complete len:217 (+) Transcript_89219:323-973(+)
MFTCSPLPRPRRFAPHGAPNTKTKHWNLAPEGCGPSSTCPRPRGPPAIGAHVDGARKSNVSPCTCSAQSGCFFDNCRHAARASAAMLEGPQTKMKRPVRAVLALARLSVSGTTSPSQSAMLFLAGATASEPAPPRALSASPSVIWQWLRSCSTQGAKTREQWRKRLGLRKLQKRYTGRPAALTAGARANAVVAPTPPTMKATALAQGRAGATPGWP